VCAPNLFILTNLAWFIIFAALPFETRANQEANLKSERYYSNGIQLSRANYWKEAADEFRKAIQVDPEHKLAYANLGVSLSQLENHKDALLAFDEAITLGYDHALLRYNRGLSFAKLNLIEEAIQELEFSLKMAPRNVKANYNLGLLYVKQNKLDGARKQVNLLYIRNNDLAKNFSTQFHQNIRSCPLIMAVHLKEELACLEKCPAQGFSHSSHHPILNTATVSPMGKAIVFYLILLYQNHADLKSPW